MSQNNMEINPLHRQQEEDRMSMQVIYDLQQEEIERLESRVHAYMSNNPQWQKYRAGDAPMPAKKQ